MNWINEHYILSFILAICIIEVIGKLIIRTYRFIMVLVRGWPKTELMDADGDIVHPKDSKWISY